MSNKINNNPFTLIGYKRSSDDYCRGCHMASYSSDFAFRNNLSAQQLTDELTVLMDEHRGEEPSECVMDYIIMKNGNVVFSDNNDVSADDPEPMDGEPKEGFTKADIKEAEDIYAAAVNASEELKKQREEKKLKQQQQIAEKNAADEKKDRHRKYLELKAEFESK